MFKKLLCTAVALSLGLSCGVYGTENENSAVTDPKNTQEVGFGGFNLTFDDEADNFGFTDISTKSSASSVLGKSGNGISVAAANYLKEFNAPVDNGVYHLSFDMLDSTANPTLFIMRFIGYDHGNIASGFDESRIFENAVISQGKMTYYTSLNGIKTSQWRRWKTSDNSVDLKSGEWNRIDMYIDMDSRYTYFYLNNDLIGKDKMCAEFKSMYGVVLTPERGICTIDNFKLEEFDYSAQKRLIGEGINVPNELIMPLKISFNETSFGYNYYGTEAEFSLNLKNDTDSDNEFNLTYDVVDDKGFIVVTKNENLSLKANESKLHSVKIKPKKYGMFTLRVKAEANGVENSTNIKHKFTMIKTPQSGVVNSKAAVHTLPSFDPLHAPYISQILDNFEKAGFSDMRSSLSRSGFANWQSWTGGKIDYGQFAPEMEYYKNSSLEHMYLLTGSCVSYNHIPVTKTELDDFYNYCYQAVLDTKDFATSYEIWNEPNAPAFNTNATAEQYAEVVKVAYKAVKAANPNAKVIGLSLSGMETGYTETVVKAAGEYMDGLAIHPYMWMQSPEGGNMVPRAKKIREIMNKYGMQDKPIWFTEIGWYTYVGMDNVAAYTTEMFLLNEIYDMAEKIFVFRYTDEQQLPREGFGLFNSIIDFEPFMARPVFLAMSAYNALMTDCEYVETINYDEVQKLYKFKLSDGRDAIVMWNKDENREIALNLGCDSVDVYDIYGNVSNISGIDKKYQFSCTGMPMYVVGNFSTVERCGDLFDIDKQVLKMVNYDKSDIKVSNMTNLDLNIDIQTTEDITKEEKTILGKGQNVINVKAENISDNKAKQGSSSGNGTQVSSEITEIFNDTGNGVEINIYSGTNLIYKKRLSVECVDPIEVTHYSEHFSGEWWQYVVNVTNNTYDTPLSGKIDISSPNEFKALIPKRTIQTIQPGETRTTIFPVPDMLDKNDLDFKAKLVMDNGYETDLSRELSFRAIPKAKTKPKIDGIIEQGEWNTAYAVEMNDKSGKYIPLGDENFGGNADASAKIYMEFDDNNFYFAAEVKDDVHSDDPDVGIWAGDSFQIATALEKLSNASYTELSIGLQNGKPQISRSSGLVAQMIAMDIPHELEINRDESQKTTTYEFSIPLTELYPANFKIKNHPSLLVSILLNDKDKEEYPQGGEGRDGMFEYGSGIGNSKNPSQFLDFNLVR